MTPQPAIDVVRPVFTDPQGLRDLLVRDATPDTWAELLAWMNIAGWRSTFWIDGHQAQRPATIQEALQVRRGDRTPVLSIEIELDVRSRDFQTDDRLSALVEFALGLSRALGKQVLLTEDNMHDLESVVFGPDRSVEAG